ncbi:MAG: alpha/beta hydrolase, partial [Alphaproteobacteria bacterium]|nr:alpha/beta hydrolase [Alphaproteobacteria bacterium]
MTRRKAGLGGLALAVAMLLVTSAEAGERQGAAGEGKAACAAQAVRPLPAARRALASFDNSAFPYDGINPADGRSFLDYDKDGQRGHTSPRGSLLLEADTYSDRRSLLFLPRGLDLSRPDKALIVVFFHGNLARLDADVVRRQRVPQQLADSGLNAALVAPQLAVNAADSSAGNFWRPGFFRQYLAEAAERLAGLHGAPCTRALLDQLGVVVVAYSGGYNPAAYALAVGGAGARLRGVVLLDALYGETDKFAAWIEGAQTSAERPFFFSAYSDSSRAENMALQQQLLTDGIELTPPRRTMRLHPGEVSFLFA